jgi:hypothetical protein
LNDLKQTIEVNQSNNHMNQRTMGRLYQMNE